MADTIQLNTRGLDQLIKSLSGKLPVVRVGILGKSNKRKDGQENATIGAKHEFGADGMPMRSFLRVPIADNLNKYLKKAGAFDKAVLTKVVKQGSIVPWLEKVAVVSEAVVQDGFSSGGFGKWPAWRTPNYENNTGLILVDTQQLRNSITSEVK